MEERLMERDEREKRRGGDRNGGRRVKETW